jgi:TetR/AcrR family transcriptional regulator, fatty acid biosynthesis regulator
VSNPARPPRTRLAPQERAQLILDAAAQLVTNEGVSAVNMDRLGRDAGISKALVYNYYPNRNDLLQALLLREVRLYQDEQRKAVHGTSDVEALIRITTRGYLNHIAQKGVLIERLMSEPSIAQGMGEMERVNREEAVEFFVAKFMEGSTISMDTARMMTELGMGLTGAGGAYLDRTGCNIELLEDMIVSMIMANIASVEKDHLSWRGSVSA